MMPKLPRVITTSVIRSAQQGESHGGVYIVDLDSGDAEQVIDWNDTRINWEGRGGDRGLRGIAFHAGNVYLAASDEIFVYDRNFKLLDSCTNKYLRRCHEIDICGSTLYLTSTDLNSILQFDLLKHRFSGGYIISRRQSKGLLNRIGIWRSGTKRFHATPFDPNDVNGPKITPTSACLHINNVTGHDDSVTVSGTRIEALLLLRDNDLCEYALLPRGTHNAALHDEGVIYNDTASNRIVIADRRNKIRKSFIVPEFDPAKLSHTEVPNDHARQGFARGLCLFGKEIVIGGSSPSTISAYHLQSGEQIKQVNLSKDIRNCIHGLELWPES